MPRWVPPEGQPTEASELANAAYLHRCRVQADLAEYLSRNPGPVWADLEGFEWHATRLRNAFLMEQRLRDAAGLREPIVDA